MASGEATPGIGEDDVRRIAGLARLRLDDDEVRTFTAQLNDILAHVEELRSAGEGEGGAAPEGQGATLGADDPGPDALLLAPAEIAPAFEEGFFTLPRLAALGAEQAEGDA